MSDEHKHDPFHISDDYIIVSHKGLGSHGEDGSHNEHTNKGIDMLARTARMQAAPKLLSGRKR